MSAEANKILLRRYIEERWNERKLRLTDELVSPDFVLHTPSGDVNLEAFNEAIAAYLGSFPDSQVSIEDLVAEEDRVAMCTASGARIAANLWESRGRESTRSALAWRSIGLPRGDWQKGGSLRTRLDCWNS